MSFHHLDHYAGLPTPLTRIAPTARLLGTVVMAIGAAMLPAGEWLRITILLAAVAAFAVAGRVPVHVLLVRLAGPLVFLIAVSALVLVTAPGNPVMRAGPIAITDTGLIAFGSIVGRGVVGLGAAVLLVSTTRYTELLEALRELRLPAVVTTSLGLAYRFLYILTDEVERLRLAARSRNAAASTIGRRRLLTGIAAAALTRSMARSERVYHSMLARGFGGRIPSLQPHPLDFASAAAVTVLTAGVASVVASAWM